MTEFARILLADSARKEMPSKCNEIAALASRSSSDEPDLSRILERLAFRDLGEDGRARDFSSLSAGLTTPLELTDAERADLLVLVVRFDDELDCGDCE